MSSLSDNAPIRERIMHALRERLRVIDGRGCFHYDVGNDIHFGKLAEDLDNLVGAALFIRVVAGEAREINPADDASPSYQRAAVFDIVGVVESHDEPGVAGERLLADIERAIELPDDRYLRDPDLDINLLSDQLILDSADVDQLEGSRYEIAAVGVRCTWPHVYGDPSHVQE